MRRQLEHALGHLLDARNARAAAADEHARPHVIKQAEPGQFRLDELQRFLQAQRHDTAQVFEVHRLQRQTQFVVARERLPLVRLFSYSRAVLHLQILRATQRHLESVGEIVRDVITADCEHPGVLDDAAAIDDVLRRAAAHVEHERAEFLLLVGQERERGGQAVEDDGFDFELQTLHHAHRVLQTVENAVDDVHVHLDARAEHSDGIDDAILSIDEKMLADGVNDVILRREIDRLRVANDILDVVLGDLAIRGHHRVNAAIGQAADMAAGHAEIHAANLHIGHQLGFDDGVAHVLAHGGSVGDLALAHAARTRLAEAHDVERAGRAHLADDGADLRGADLQADDDGCGIKHVFSCREMVWPGGRAAAEARPKRQPIAAVNCCRPPDPAW